jgi:hypothetical protein
MAYNATARKEPKSEPQHLVSEKQKRLWHALHDFIRHHGGEVVSLPGHRELRIEVPKDSALASKLTEAGYAPRHCCTETRIAAGVFKIVDVIAITMPGE